MHIIVVGGGIIGLTCSWKLALRGAQVTLLESRTIGQGASGAALGALWPPSALHRDPPQCLHRDSLWQFEAFVAALTAATPLPIAFARGGRMELLNSEKAAIKAQEEIAVANREWPALSLGHPAQEFLPPAMLQQILPDCSATAHGALLCHNTAQVRVQSLLAALRSACELAGVALHENTPATMPGPGVIATHLGTHRPDAVLITAGAWTRSLISAAPITPAKGQAIAMARPKSLKLRRILKSGGTYLVPWENEILVGATTEPAALLDETPTSAAHDRLRQAAAELVPELAGAKVLRHWTGLRPDAPGHRALMGPVVGSPRTYICAGHYKTGIAVAPRVGDLMTRLILDGVVEAPLSAFLP